jgi:bisphosphoglycerate-independent phosphoglycerate mutase (AlkP superfamily)
VGHEDGKPIVGQIIEPMQIPAPNRKKGLGRERHVSTTVTSHEEVAAADNNQGRVFVFDTKRRSEIVARGQNPDMVAAFGVALRHVRAVEEVSLEVAGADPVVRCGHGGIMVGVASAREQNS